MDAETQSRLEALGASNLDGVEGEIPVSSPPSEPRILEYTVKDTTPLWRQARPYFVPRTVRRLQVAHSLGLVGIEGFFSKSCTQYKDPKILLNLIPVRLVNMAFHVFSLKLSGDIVNKYSNTGEEGEEGKTTVKRWQSCPTDPDKYSWSKVAGSADVGPDWGHGFADDASGKTLGNVSQALDKVNMGNYAEAQASWTSGGLGDLVWQIIQLLRTGSISTRNGFDVNITYTWQGSKTISQHIDAKVIVPVKGVSPGSGTR